MPRERLKERKITLLLSIVGLLVSVLCGKGAADSSLGTHNDGGDPLYQTIFANDTLPAGSRNTGIRKLVPATHRFVEFLGRWNPPNRTLLQSANLTLGTDGDLSSRDGAVTGFKNAGVYLRFTGTRQLSVHIARRGALNVYARIIPGGMWTQQTWNTPSQIFASGLKTRRNYTVEIRFVFPIGLVEFRGFGLYPRPSSKPMPPTKPALRILEFVGDSITSWFTPVPARARGPANFAMEACRILNSRCSFVSQPGFGVTNLPPTYRKIGANQSLPTWNPRTRGYVPQVVVINLGTNDGGLISREPQTFVLYYVSFIADIRRLYGSATRTVVMLPFGFRNPGSSAVIPVVPASLGQSIVDQAGRTNTFLMNTDGWLNAGNSNRYMLDFVHPNPDGLSYLGGRVAGALRSMRLV